MAHGQDIRLYVEKTQEFVKHIECENWLVLNVNIIILNNKLLDIQKDILTDFIATFKDKAGYDKTLMSDDIAEILEAELEELNIKLLAFTDKIENLDDHFSIKWSIQVVYNEVLFSSLIWDVSILIVRNNQTYYTASNDVLSEAAIDLFSDFIEWEITAKDKVVVLWTNYKNFLDQTDMKELNDIWIFDNKDIISFFEKLFTTKIEATELCFILIQWFEEKKVEKPGFLSKFGSLWNNKLTKWLSISKFSWIDQKFLIKNKYNITIAVLWLFIVFLAINVISTISGWSQNQPQFILEDWTKVTIDIDTIKKDINDFANLDATDPKKASIYQKITEQLWILESENRWPDEVKKRKEFVEAEYYKWFNIVLIDDINKNTNYFNNIYTFTNEQKQTLWTPVNVLYNNQSMYIPWNKWAIIQAISTDIRWTTLSYNDSSIDMNVCSLDLSRQWMYCADKNSNLYRVTAGWLQPLFTEDAFFSWPIKDIWTFASSNMYVLHENQSFEADNKQIISRYSNKIWSYTDFGNSTKYINRFLNTATWQSQNFESMSIDWTFLIWESVSKKLYQLWREPEAVSELSSREVPLLGWDIIANWFSENVKVIQLTDSPFVYLYDKDNQSLTIYRSNPSKTSAGKQQSYDLLYVFRIQFWKETNKIIDISIPDTNSNFLYILTENWVYEANLETFIRQFE